MIELKGYASASGRAALNQTMSQERASNVLNIPVQQGHMRIPLTNMLAPGAMGEGAEAAKEDRTRKLRIIGWWSGYFRIKPSLGLRRTMA